MPLSFNQKEEVYDALSDILEAAYRFNDKPHQLFSAIRHVALRYETDPDICKEVIRLMDRASEQVGTAHNVWSDE